MDDDRENRTSPPSFDDKSQTGEPAAIDLIGCLEPQQLRLSHELSYKISYLSLPVHQGLSTVASGTGLGRAAFH